MARRGQSKTSRIYWWYLYSHTQGNWEAWSKKMKLNLWVWTCSDGILLKVRLSQPLVQSDTLRRRGCLVVVGETNQQQKTISQLIFKAETFSTWEEWWSCWMLSTWVSRWDVTTASWGRPKGAKYTSLHLSSQHLLSLFSLFHTITILLIVIPGALLVSRPTLKLSGGNCQVSPRAGKTGWVDHLFAMWSGMKNLFSFYKKVETKHVPKSCRS